MLYIQNQWTSGRGKLFKSMNPFTGEIVWEGNFANASQLNAAMHAAYKSHDGWSAESIQTRIKIIRKFYACLLYTSPSPRDLSTSRMPSSA